VWCGTDVAIGMGDTLSMSLLVGGIVGGMAFLVFISLAILDRVEELKINR